MKKVSALLAMALLLASCATVEVTSAPPEKDKKDQREPDGIIFYQPELYLWVTQNKAENKEEKKADSHTTVTSSSGEYAYTFITLPNPKKRHAIKQIPGFGSSNLSITLKDGWRLDSYSHDAAAKIGDFLPVTGSLAGTAALTRTAAKTKPPMALGLYKIVYDENGIFKQFELVQAME